MKNTKELFIRLYTETLYSNFIVPLRGSDYIQLLYGGLKERLGFFFKQTRWLVWREHINEVGQKLYRSWAGFEVDSLKQDLTETWLEVYQSTTKTLPKNVPDVSPKCHQKMKILNWDIEAKNCINLSTIFHRKNTTKLPLKYHQKLEQMSASHRQKSREEISI